MMTPLLIFFMIDRFLLKLCSFVLMNTLLDLTVNAVPNQAMRTSLTLKTAAARYYITGSYSLATKQYTEALHILYDVGHQQQEVQVYIYIYHVCCISLACIITDLTACPYNCLLTTCLSL